MKKYIYPLAITATALFATACSDNEVDDIQNIPDSQKEMISFSLSDGTTNTRAGFTGADTRIVARIQSDKKDASDVLYTRTVLKAAKDATGGSDDFSVVSYYTSDNTRYWDDAFGRLGQISVYAVAIPNSTSDAKLSDAKLTGGSTWAAEATPNNTIEWDVTYSTSQTSTTLAGEDLAYSNNIQDGGKNGRYVWSYTDPVGYPANNGKIDGHKDGRLVFTQKDGAQSSDAGHFDKGHLVFKHALSRLTVVLTPGTGFTSDRSTATDFKFNKIEGAITSGNIQLLNFPVHGKLDLDAGTWAIESSDGTQNILQMIGAAATSSASTSAAAYNATAETYLANRTYAAQMLPGKIFNANGTDNVMQFVIDDNTYYITEKMVYEALTSDASGTWYNTHKSESTVLSAAGYNVGTSVTMAQGHNYTLNITVNKTGIANVTATLAPWVEVAGSMEVNNAHLTFSISADGATCGKDIDLYRLDDNYAGYDADNYTFTYQGKNWLGNYSTDDKHKTELLHSALSSGKWTTPWYFESNKTYYHFRTVNKGTTIKGNTDATNDYFEISAGPQSSTDPHWGAPMTSAVTTTYLKYDTSKGYEDFLMPAIGATESQIAIQELHMMSNINVVLKTVSGDGKVKLQDGSNNTIVKITRIAKEGKVEMGRGLVTPADTYTDELKMTEPSSYFKTDGLETNAYTYAVVPQALSRNSSSTSDDDYISIFIQTPDGNQYYVVKQLSDILATSVSGGHNVEEDQKITHWYPGHSYTYTFTLSKKGIENITCTLFDWITVSGNDTPIDLES